MCPQILLLGKDKRFLYRGVVGTRNQDPCWLLRLKLHHPAAPQRLIHGLPSAAPGNEDSWCLLLDDHSSAVSLDELRNAY